MVVDEADLAEGAKLYVVDAADEAVTFSMDPDTFEAASEEQTIEFVFTAEDTPVKAGKVWFEVPSSWTKPVKTDDAAGEVTVSGGGTTDPDDISISTRRGRYRITISDVALNNADAADAESSVTITYKKVTIQDDATPAG